MTATETHAEKMTRIRAEIAATKAETARLRAARMAMQRAIAKATR